MRAEPKNTNPTPTEFPESIPINYKIQNEQLSLFLSTVFQPILLQTGSGLHSHAERCQTAFSHSPQKGLFWYEAVFQSSDTSQHTPCVVLLVQRAHPWWSACDSSPLSTVTSYWNPALVTCPNNFHFPQDFPQLFRHFRDHPHINKTFLSPPLVLMDIIHGSTKITSCPSKLVTP